MVTLAFQTASGPAEIALLRTDGADETGGDGAFVQTDMVAGQGQDARLPGLLTGLLDEAGLALGEVTRIGVVNGPGSFTGLRMGLAFARGLGLVLGCPVLGISLLQAALPPGETRPVRIALQARKRPPDISFWCQDFNAGQPESPPAEVPLADLLASQRLVLTDGTDRLADAAQALPARPLARFVAHWASVQDPDSAPPSPVYVRPPDAVLPGNRAP